LTNDFNTGAAGSFGGFRQQEDIEMRKTGLRKTAGGTAPGVAAALVLAFALVTIGCREDGDEGALGETLQLTGDVWIAVRGLEPARFTESRTLESFPPGGEGEIADGRLSFSIGRPAPEHLRNIRELMWYMSDYLGEFNAAPGDAGFVMLTLFPPNGLLMRLYSAETPPLDTVARIFHVFVDRDVTLDSEAISESETWDDFSWAHNVEAFDITLREGWNALRLVTGVTRTENGIAIDASLFRDDPDHMRWILEEWTVDDWTSEDLGW